MRKYMTPLLASGGLLALATAFAPANATLQIAATINGSTFFCADQTACDTNSAVGTLVTNPATLGGVEFNGSQQIQTIGPPTNTLFTNSFSIHNTTAGTVDIAFAIGGTDFASPTTVFSAAGSGTYLNAAGSTITMTYYGDTANGQGADSATDAPGSLLANSGLITAGPGTDAYQFNQDGAFVTSSPYSWTMLASGTLTAGATANLIGRSQDLTNDVTPVPEPASLLLLGTALAGMGWFLRRRKRHDDGHDNFAAA